MRLKTALILILFTSLAASAQPKVVDSLVVVLNGMKDDRQKAKLLHRIVSATWDFDFNRALTYSNEINRLADKLKDDEIKTIALTDLGMYHYFVGNYAEADKYYKQALEVAGTQNFGEFPAYTITRIGNLYRVQGEYDSALVFYKRSESLLIKAPPGIALGSLYFHYGWLFQELSQFRESFVYLYKARNIRYQIGDSLLIAECWRVMATSHLGLTDMDSARYYLRKVQGVAKRFGDTELVIFSNINMGDYYQARGMTIEAIQSYQAALDSLAKHDFKRYKALAISQIGRVFDSRSDYVKSIEYYLDALKINEQLNSRHEIARIHAYMGWAHNNLGNFVEARLQAKRALQLMRAIKDKAGMALTLNLLGNIAFNSRDNVTALTYYDSALTIRKELSLHALASNTIFNIGRTYERLGRYDEALQAYFDDLDIASKIQNHRVLALSHNSIGLVYAYKGDFKNAEKYLQEGQRLSMQFGQPVDVRDNYFNFARLYKLSGQYKKSVEYYELYIQANDSLQIRESATQALQRDALYQLDKKNKEIQTLNGLNQLKEEQIAAQHARIRFQNTILALIVVALLLISVVAYMLFRYNKSKAMANLELSKLNKAIHEQKEEIEAQTEELTEANETIQEINKGLETAVEQRTQQLKQAYNELDTFIYRSSHDLRRPLTTFMGLAEVARISVKDSTAIELFNKVNETAHNLDRILSKLQAVSHIASSELIARGVSFDDELDFVLDLYQDNIVEKKIKVVRQVKINRPFVSHPLIIRVILENLIENAIQFASSHSPFIFVHVSQVGNTIVIEVKDNGEGVAEEFHNRLFDMYFRANERSKGNGLGLYLVRKATEKLNGQLEYSSNNPSGSIFTIRLPFQEMS